MTEEELKAIEARAAEDPFAAPQESLYRWARQAAVDRDDLLVEARRLKAERDSLANDCAGLARSARQAEREKCIAECVGRLGTMLLAEDVRRYVTQHLLMLRTLED